MAYSVNRYQAWVEENNHLKLLNRDKEASYYLQAQIVGLVSEQTVGRSDKDNHV